MSNEACMPSGPGAVPAFNAPSFRNTLEDVKETYAKLLLLAIRQGSAGQEPSSIVNTDEK